MIKHCGMSQKLSIAESCAKLNALKRYPDGEEVTAKLVAYLSKYR